ncbi:hypothetical protein Tco_0399784 [Tanacetum coccineum]
MTSRNAPRNTYSVQAPFGGVTIVVCSQRPLLFAPLILCPALVVEKTLVASPTGLCGVGSLYGFDSDSTRQILHQSTFPPTSYFQPFRCTDSSEAPDSSDGPPSQDPYVATVARWRSRVTSRPSSSSEFPIMAPVTDSLLSPIRPRISFRRQRLFFHPGRLFLLVDLTAPILTGRIITHLLPVHLRILRQFILWDWAFRRWCAAPLSTLYPSTTSESSSGDSSEGPMHSSPHSAGPSRKRCRSPVDSVPLSMLVTDISSATPVLISHHESVRVSIGDGDEEEIVDPSWEGFTDSSSTKEGIVRSVPRICPVAWGVRALLYHPHV